jgi:adenylylsulfate kinase
VSWAVWLTGLPASGKSTLARALIEVAAAQGIRLVHLESDALRRILTPQPTYDPAERDRFYAQVAGLAALLVAQGFSVVVDATGPRRAHRDMGRARIARFLEVYVQTPLDVCEKRDPKGIYGRARRGEAPHVPGATEPYEEPDRPDFVVSGAGPTEAAVPALLRLVRERGFL